MDSVFEMRAVRRQSRYLPIAALVCVLVLAACGDAGSPEAVEVGHAPADIPFEPLTGRSSGDLEAMIERRRIRALVPYSRTFYFLDAQGNQRGLSHSFMQAFEQHINERLERRLLRVSVVLVPVTREQLIPWLLDGRGDLIAADLTMTAARAESVLFTEALARDVRELLVSGPNAAPVASLEDLAGRNVLVRRESSYFDSLQKLNRQLVGNGLPVMRLEIAAGHFEVGDVLEMVSAGVADYAVADEYLAGFWSSVLPGLTVHDSIELRSDADIGFAVRPESRALKAELDRFLETHRAGTLFGNVQFQRFLEDTRWVSDPTRKEALVRFEKMADLFRRYAGRYDLDWLLLTAQGYQESRLDHSASSPAGAVGVMQLLPSTGAEMEVGDIGELENNIHAAAKYVRFMIDRYYSEPAIGAEDRILLALASYNAGPRRIRQLRDQARREGLDPNRWFDHVEVIAARRIGRETVDYVRNIFKYYVAYKLILERNRQVEQRPEL
ncbi:MAG: transporter substrate-binding domain-containing protein [Wenzhouxiangellaceae bacterium]|nr:transporter substrate-binding domain-containing protein [Wenzhouxiangellaceae bacterium]